MINEKSQKSQDKKPINPRISKARIKAALEESFGIITAAAVKLGYTRDALSRIIQTNPDLKEYQQKARERLIDLAESKLTSKINRGDSTCIIFALKTLGKNRGFVERQEVTGVDGEPIKHEIAQRARDKFNTLIENRLKTLQMAKANTNGHDSTADGAGDN